MVSGPLSCSQHLPGEGRGRDRCAVDRRLICGRLLGAQITTMAGFKADVENAMSGNWTETYFTPCCEELSNDETLF